jgi:hypothetical protein
MQAQEAAMQQQTMQDLGGAGAGMIDTAAGSGAVSGDFERAKAGRQAMEGDRMAAIAGELARVRAPGQTLSNEAQRRSALAEQLGSLWAQNRAQAGAAGRDAEAVEEPLYGQLGQLASMVGTAGGLMNAKAPAAPKPAPRNWLGSSARFGG